MRRWAICFSTVLLFNELDLVLIVGAVQEVGAVLAFEYRGTPFFVDTRPVDVKAVLAFIIYYPGTRMRGCLCPHRVAVKFVIGIDKESAIRLVSPVPFTPRLGDLFYLGAREKR